MNIIQLHHYMSPCGEMLLGSFDGKLCLCGWATSKRRDMTDRRLKRLLNAEFTKQESYVITETIRQLDEYFSGKRTEFQIPLLMAGSDFQKSVWAELLKIPYGETITYGEQAKRHGNSKAVRAVASANGSNPVAIIVPCHRVIGSNHSLTGYAGGLDIKRNLLDLESATKER